MARYRNRNTGDVVEYDEPNARLEALDNWERLDRPEPKAKATKKSGRKAT